MHLLSQYTLLQRVVSISKPEEVFGLCPLGKFTHTFVSMGQITKDFECGFVLKWPELIMPTRSDDCGIFIGLEYKLQVFPTILKNHRKYRQCGTSLNRNHGNSGRPRAVRTPQDIQIIQCSFNENSNVSPKETG